MRYWSAYTCRVEARATKSSDLAFSKTWHLCKCTAVIKCYDLHQIFCLQVLYVIHGEKTPINYNIFLTEFEARRASECTTEHQKYCGFWGPWAGPRPRAVGASRLWRSRCRAFGASSFAPAALAGSAFGRTNKSLLNKYTIKYLITLFHGRYFLIHFKSQGNPWYRLHMFTTYRPACSIKPVTIIQLQGILFPKHI